ncbi:MULTISPECIES: hypothetical protein [unclassified Aerococcus]|uniref:hypothetical protein n=1 Tax=unclassified Aerococcus TaxID=2618060 RepID=UPI0025B8B34D|nr:MULTISPECIES: hypothetical protein [unclassified Aerococcus]
MIEIKVTGDSAKEVFIDLQELTAQATPTVNQEAVQAIAEAVANPEAPKAETKQKPAPKAKAKPEPVEEKPAEAPAEEVAEAPKAENVKLSDVQNALAKILREQPEHKSDAAEILKNHGVKRVSELKEEDFATVKAELESIGD